MSSRAQGIPHAKKPEPAVLAFLLLCCVLLSGCAGPTPPQLFTGSTMGTTYSVQIAEELVTPEQQNLGPEIDAILADINASMSTYQGDSELSVLNRAELDKALPISAPLIEVLHMAQEVARLSSGAFDVTVLPLVELWGFGNQEARTTPPTADAIEQARALLGTDSLQLDKGAATLLRSKPVTVDLSAIAKGYAVDRLARLLFKRGLRNYLVEVGGELRASGRNNRGRYWTVGIETPDQAQRVPYQAVMLNNKAIATSGDYRNYFEYQGVRYSHTLDPRSGWPVRHALASVSVVHDSAAMADAWATALTVLGAEQGLALANAQGLKALFILRADQGGFESQESQAYTAYNESLQEN